MERARLEVQARRERAVRLLVRGSHCTATIDIVGGLEGEKR